MLKNTGHEEISLSSLSSSDYSELEGIVNFLIQEFGEKNINISDELLAFMVSKDAGETKKAVDSFVELFNAAVNEAVKGKARQETPKDSGGFSASKASLGIGDMAREARIIK